MDATVSIGEVKRDISELVNRVAFGGERIVLTSRGKPKAVLVNVEDYRRLQAQEQSNSLQQWDEWMAQARQLSAEILARRQGQPIDVAQIEQAARADLEGRWDELFFK
ncbi:MAG: type II toxin-antitoxin system Phd/YefM family antitoxin [Caldilineaceae bacterium]|nr:type II toxin-antitoxin system Phd/YefM family antitoxin [Caldilineaceae bacterium]